MPKRHRRVVTGHDAEGRSVVLMDGESPHGFFLDKAGGLQLTELWETRSSPADNSGAQDAADHERRIEPVIWPASLALPAGFRLALTLQGKDFERPEETGVQKGSGWFL